MLELWTWQGKGFDIHRGTIDPNCGEFANVVSGYLNAVAELAAHLGTDQFCWAQGHSKRWDGRTGYRLNVPDGEVLGVVDGFLWDLRIGARQVRPPSALRARWKTEAQKLFPKDSRAQRQHEERRRQKWWDRPCPPDWLAEALEKGPSSENPQFLLPFPIPREWVVETIE